MAVKVEARRSNEAGALAEQLCSAELQAQDWRRRCFQAEAQLRLERLKRRGEQHPRWPPNAMQQQTLMGKHAALQASDIVGSTKQVLWDLVHAKTTLGQLEEDLEQSSQEVQKRQKEAAQKREDAITLTEGQAAEDAAFAQKELDMNSAKDRAGELARLLQESFTLENELAEKVALGQDAMEVVHRKLQAFLPGQQKVQEEAQKALQEADRFRVLAQRRREAVTKTEEEVDQVEKSGQEENAALQLRLEQTRDELSEMVAKTADLGNHSVTAMNIFRIFRVGRGVALLARIDWFRPMYLAAVGFKHSLASLLVVALYLGTLLFTSSLILCNLLGPSSPEYLNYPSILRGRFRSVGTSYLTLIESLLGGNEWGPDLVDLLLQQEMVFPGIVFFSFMIFGSLLWLNTVAGIFMQQVDRSFEATNVHQFKDPEFKAATQELLKDFQQDLKELDRDELESLSWRQISLVVTHHLEILSDLGIRLPEAKKIFSELDMNNTGFVSIPMFISRLIDNLKYKTLETLLFENQQGRLLYLMKKQTRRNKASSKKVMEQLKVMSESIAEVESEEPLQAAVQRRLWKQKQRVAIEREQLYDSIVDADLTMPGPRKTQTSGAGLFGQEGIKTKGHLVLDCWKRVNRERALQPSCFSESQGPGLSMRLH